MQLMTILAQKATFFTIFVEYVKKMAERTAIQRLQNNDTDS